MACLKIFLVAVILVIKDNVISSRAPAPASYKKELEQVRKQINAVDESKREDVLMEWLAAERIVSKTLTTQKNTYAGIVTTSVAYQLLLQLWRKAGLGEEEMDEDNVYNAFKNDTDPRARKFRDSLPSIAGNSVMLSNCLTAYSKCRRGMYQVRQALQTHVSAEEFQRSVVISPRLNQDEKICISTLVENFPP